MAVRYEAPRFGEADLSNCERELIHLSGSIQPHGVLLVLAEPRLTVIQASANVGERLGLATDVLLGSPIEALGLAAAQQIRAVVDENVPAGGTVFRSQSSPE